MVRPMEDFLGGAPARREFQPQENGLGLGGGSLIKSSISEVGAYTGRFNNLSPITYRINNPSPNLTTALRDPSSGPDARAPVVHPPPDLDRKLPS